MEGELPISEALQLAASHGFQAIELCIERSGALSLSSTEADCAIIRDLALSLGLSLPSLASKVYWEQALGDSDADAREGAKQDLLKMIQISGWLGAKTLLTIPGVVDSFFMPDRPTEDYASVSAHVTKGLNEILPKAASVGVRLGIENVWNKFLLSPAEMVHFIDSFNSPWVGAYVDVANMLLYGYPEQWLRLLGKRVVGVHFKDFRRAVGTAEGFVDLLEGDVNWPAVMAALTEIGYDGPVVAEMIPLYKHHPLVRVANASRAMDAILGGLS
jgi:hexulose-6-phosphate isomerase